MPNVSLIGNVVRPSNDNTCFNFQGRKYKIWGEGAALFQHIRKYKIWGEGAALFQKI